MAVTFPTSPINGQTFSVGDVTYTYSGGMWSSEIGATNPSTGPSTSEYTYTAANNQTSFSGADNYGQTMAYTAGQIGVFLNGVRLVANTDYTATNGTTVTLTEGTSENDILAVQNIVNVSGAATVANTTFQSFVANTNAYIADVAVNAGEVSNSYLTSTYTTNAAFQSALANTNVYIATKLDSSSYTTADVQSKAALANTNAYIASVAAAGGGATVSTSAPNETTNASEGDLWVDTTDDYLYVCVDDTTDSNVWLRAELADPPLPYSFQGSYYGYNSGGLSDNAIDKFSFASDGNASEIGQITSVRYYVSGQSSADYGYTTGHVAPNPNANVIDRFPFATDGSAADVGDLTTTTYTWRTGQSSENYGYVSGGGPTSPGSISTVERWSFATASESASSFANLSVARKLATGISDGENGWGYTSGGLQPGSLNIIDKFPFASGGSGSDVGDLTVARRSGAGQSSTTYGYTSGGNSPTKNQIDKFPFASNANATDVGDLSVGRYYVAGQSSTTYGYTSGGRGTPSYLDIIDKFSFSTNGNATDVGNLTAGKYSCAGQQY